MRSLLFFVSIYFYSLFSFSNELENAVEFYNKKDYVKVIEIIRPAVERKDPRALNQMGSLYEKGLGVAKDLSQAFRFYKEAADLGDSSAQFNVGLMYQYGRHVKSDVDVAIMWYKKSVDSGDKEGDAAYNLGVLYARDSRVKRNIPLGMQYYQMAFSKGNAMAAYNLGVIHSDGLNGLPVNKKLAVFYYTIASLKDYPAALHNLSVMYQNGDGVIQNYEESIRYNVRAIKKNVADSMSALSAKYMLGIGVPANMRLAHMWALIAKNNDASNTDVLLKVSSDRLSRTDLIEAQNLAIQCQQSEYENCQYPKFVATTENIEKPQSNKSMSCQADSDCIVGSSCRSMRGGGAECRPR